MTMYSTVLNILNVSEDDIITIQQISNHPLFPNVERYVLVNLQLANSNAKTFEFWFSIGYIQEGVNVTSNLAQPSNTRIYTDSNIKQLLRNPLTFEPLDKPDYNEEDYNEDNPATEYDMYQWEYGWDMVMRFFKDEIIIDDVLKKYIIVNDVDGFFNQ